MGILDYDKDGQFTPQQYGLLQAGLAMMANSRGRSFGEALGAGGLAGMQGMQDQQQVAQQQQLIGAREQELKARAAANLAEAQKAQMMEQYKQSIDPKRLNDPNYRNEVMLKLGMIDQVIKSQLPGERILLNDANAGAYTIDKNTGQAYPVEFGGKQLRAAPYDPNLQGAIAGARNDAQTEKVTLPNGQEQYRRKGDITTGSAPQNNFGNIRPQGSSTGFQSFGTPQEGLAAIDQNLRAYADRGINTLEGVISRWAPSSENDTGAYIAHASQVLGIDPRQPIDLNQPQVRQAIGTAIMLHEQGPKNVFGQSTADKEAIKVRGAIDEAAGKEKIKVDATNMKRENSAKNMLSIANQKFDGKSIPEWIDEATGSGAGAFTDKIASTFGVATSGAMANEKLKTIQGWLVSNVPRMEGPQSDFDVKNYQQMASNISDPSVPAEIKKSSFNTMVELQNKYAHLNGGDSPKQQEKPTGKVKFLGFE